MRTLTQMQTALRGYAVDPNSIRFSDNQLATELSRAANTLWDVLVNDPRGQAILRTKQAPQLLLANWDEYPYPTDVMRIEKLESRDSLELSATLTCGTIGTTTIGTWTAITAGCFRARIEGKSYDIMGVDFTGDTDMDDVAATIQAAIRAATGGVETCTYDTDTTALIMTGYERLAWLSTSPYADATLRPDISGSGLINGQAGSATPSVAVGYTEWMCVPPGTSPAYAYPRLGGVIASNSPTGANVSSWQQIDNQTARFQPMLNTANGLYRFQYLRKPAFPVESYEMFTNIPDGADDLVEYMAAVLLGFKKVESDGAKTKINAFGSAFQSKLDAYLQGSGGGIVREAGQIQIVED